MASALAGLVVLDVSESVAGQFCGRLFSDFGAAVILGEPDGGSATRQIGPFDATGRSLTHLHLNLGKATQADVEARAGQGSVDVVLCGAGQGEGFREAHPRAIVAEISAFGSDGPCAGWAANEMILQAVSGMMNANGEAGREPLYGTGERASYAAGLAAYIAVMSALFGRRGNGRGDLVRVDAAETAASMAFPYLQQYLYSGNDRRRGAQDQPFGLVLCRGAWVCIWVYSNRFRRLCEALGLQDCLTDPQFADLRERSGNWRAFFERVARTTADRDADELVAQMQALDIISARAYRITEIRRSEHLAQRNYWRQVEYEGESFVIPGPPFRMSATPAIEHGAAL